MPTSEHEAYRARVAAYFRAHAEDPDECAWLHEHAQQVAMLWELDLGVAREALERCYAAHPRGGDPWDPVVKLRSLHASALLGEPRLNRWVRALRCNERLRVLIGVQPPPEGSRRGKAPSVDAHYGLMHRLHDGPLRHRPDLLPPSVLQRQRAQAVRSRQLPPVPELSEETADDDKAARLVDKLRAGRDQGNPNDLHQRLQFIHLRVAVQPSAQRGLLGDLTQLVVASDGTALVTNANGRGRRVCDCPKTARCDCPRVYADPDASWGYDSYRDIYFFGHHLYELTVSSQGFDLPLSLSLSSGNETDQTAGPRAWDRWLKTMSEHCPGWTVTVAVEDAGHDSLANHRFFGEHGIKPVIPLAHAAPRVHPTRPDLLLSDRGVPVCEAGLEMSPKGSARPGCPIFLCPVKAGKRVRCPKTPEGAADSWYCDPQTKFGPAVTTRVADDARIFPVIPRNSVAYQRHYGLRSGCERSFATKKEVYELLGCKHRRASFWLIRSYGLAALQHARAWVAALDLRAFVGGLLEPPAAPPSEGAAA
jgi:hypothetical protein